MALRVDSDAASTRWSRADCLVFQAEVVLATSPPGGNGPVDRIEEEDAVASNLGLPDRGPPAGSHGTPSPRACREVR